MLLLGSDTFTVMMDEDGSELSLWAGSRSIIRTGHRQSERAWRVCRRLAGYFDESRVRSMAAERRLFEPPCVPVCSATHGHGASLEDKLRENSSPARGAVWREPAIGGLGHHLLTTHSQQLHRRPIPTMDTPNPAATPSIILLSFAADSQSLRAQSGPLPSRRP